MRFTELPIRGAFLVDIEPREDERGFFARTVCTEEFSRHGLNAAFVQQSVSWNPHRGILRGLHFQAAPWEEEKLVRVTRGSLFDVVVDLRPGSATFARWHGVELGADNHAALYIPKGVAHGFQTLSDATEVFYEMTVAYQPEAARGVRWDDPRIAIDWPDAAGARLSPRDEALPFLDEALA